MDEIQKTQLEMVTALRVALQIKDWPEDLKEAHLEAKWMYLIGLTAGRTMELKERLRPTWAR